MLSIRLDPTSSLTVRWPESYRAIVAMGEAYVAYEGSLPAEAQLQDVPLTAVQSALTAAKAAITAARSGEQGRASAGELVQQTDAALKPLIDKIFLQLKLNHFDHLARLELWGLDTVMDQNGVRVRKPGSQRQRLEFLRAYVAKEASLPPAQQISDPPLATMQAHLATLQTGLTERTSGRDQREVHVEVRDTAVTQLLNLLKIAAAIRVAITHNGVLTHELQLWGFAVSGRVRNGNGSNGREEEPVVEEAPVVVEL